MYRERGGRGGVGRGGGGGGRGGREGRRERECGRDREGGIGEKSMCTVMMSLLHDGFLLPLVRQ